MVAGGSEVARRSEATRAWTKELGLQESPVGVTVRHRRGGTAGYARARGRGSNDGWLGLQIEEVDGGWIDWMDGSRGWLATRWIWEDPEVEEEWVVGWRRREGWDNS